MDSIIYQMSGMNIQSKFEVVKPGDNVEIVISCPLSGDILYTYYCSRAFLECRSVVFQDWFKQVDFYKDYIEIGENGYSGLSDLMLFYENPETGFYSFCINCSMYANILGVISSYSNTGIMSDISNESEKRVPIILRVLEYIDGTYSSNEYRFIKCLEYLKINY